MLCFFSNSKADERIDSTKLQNEEADLVSKNKEKRVCQSGELDETEKWIQVKLEIVTSKKVYNSIW